MTRIKMNDLLLMDITESKQSKSFLMLNFHLKDYLNLTGNITEKCSAG